MVKLQEFGSAKEGEVPRIMEISSEFSEQAKGSCLAPLVLAVTMGYYGTLWSFEFVYVNFVC